MYLENIVVDALDPRRLGGFWEAALGCERLTDEPDVVETRLTVPGGPVLDLCFQQVPEPPGPAPRLHLDLAGGGHQAAVVERLLGLGARPLDVGQGDVAWVVLADPDGNPFCVMEQREAYAGSGPLAALPLDSADPDRDAGFWSWLTGWTEVDGVAPPLAAPPHAGRPAARALPGARSGGRGEEPGPPRRPAGGRGRPGRGRGRHRRPRRTTGGAGLGRAALAALRGPVGQRLLRPARARRCVVTRGPRRRPRGARAGVGEAATLSTP